MPDPYEKKTKRQAEVKGEKPKGSKKSRDRQGHVSTSRASKAPSVRDRQGHSAAPRPSSAPRSSQASASRNSGDIGPGVRRLADFAQRRAAGSGASGGALSGLGGVFSRLSDSLGSAVSTAAGGHTTFDALLERIMGNQPAMPSAPSYTPALMDVNSVVAPFAGYRDATNKQYEQNRSRLDELAAQGLRDTQMVQQAGQNRLADLERLRQADLARNAAVIAQSQQAGMADLAAQGVDPSILATNAAANQQRAGDIEYAAQAGLNRIQDMKSSEAIDAARRADELATGKRDSSEALDRNLFAAMAQLQAQEAAARTQAEQFNAQAMNQAAQGNYEGQMADFQNRQAQQDRLMQLPGALGEAASSLGAFTNPRRESVIGALANGDPSSFRSQLLGVLQKFDNPDDAKAEAMNLLAAYNDMQKEAGRPQRTVPNLDRWIQDWYYQNGSLTNDGFRQLGTLFGSR